MAGEVLSDDAAQHVAAELSIDETDMQRLQADIDSAIEGEPKSNSPDVRDMHTLNVRAEQETISFWHEEHAVDEGRQPQVWQLTNSQREAYYKLKEAGMKQLLTFLSGEGGMGKSLLVS